MDNKSTVTMMSYIYHLPCGLPVENKDTLTGFLRTCLTIQPSKIRLWNNNTKEWSVMENYNDRISIINFLGHKLRRTATWTINLHQLYPVVLLAEELQKNA